MPDHLCDQHCDPECEAATEDWGDHTETDWRTDDDGEEEGY